MARKSAHTAEDLAASLAAAEEKLTAANDTAAALATQLNSLRSTADAALRPHQRTPALAAELTAAQTLLTAFYAANQTTES